MKIGTMSKGSKCSICGSDLSNKVGVEVDKDYCGDCFKKKKGWK